MEFGLRRWLVLLTAAMQNTALDRGEAESTDAGPAPASESHPREPLSRTLWGIEWSRLLPVELPGDLGVRASSFDGALPFIRSHYAAIFQEDAQSPFSSARLDPIKERYYRVAGDFFELVHGERTVGLMVCTPGDWSTYYIRSAAILPEYRGHKAIENLIAFLLPHVAAAGVERVEADVSPQNVATATLLRNQGFHTSGTILTDRWGAHTRQTRFLAPEREDVFLRQFCSGVRPKRRGESGASQHPTGQERSTP